MCSAFKKGDKNGATDDEIGFNHSIAPLYPKPYILYGIKIFLVKKKRKMLKGAYYMIEHSATENKKSDADVGNVRGRGCCRSYSVYIK